MSQSKLSQPFLQTILNAVTEKAKQDPLFAVHFEKENKNIEDCCSYILNTVKQSGVQGFTDDEVYSIAYHYYIEDDIVVSPATACRVVINQQVQLTDEEIAEAKKKAKEILIANETSRLNKKSSPVSTAKSDSQTLTLF